MFEKVIAGRNKRVVVFLVLIFLLSTFMAASHHHENAADRDCPVCIAGNRLSATGPLVVVFDGIPCFTETTFVASAPVLTDTLLSRSRSTRGPPA